MKYLAVIFLLYAVARIVKKRERRLANYEPAADDWGGW